MKPKIDINSPIFKIAMAIHEKEVTAALEIDVTVERAVIPIASIPKTKMHRSPKRKPEQIGSGVLVNIKDQYFVFSSTHVFTSFEGSSFFTSSGGTSLVEQIGGERISSGRIDNPIDVHDATAFHIQSDISEDLRRIAISMDDLDLAGYDDDKPIYMITGFRSKESNTSGNLLKSIPRNFPTVEIDDYNTYGANPESQILLAYENQVFVNGRWQQSPKPKGMSGGGIIKAQGTSLNIKKSMTGSRKTSRQLLTAITIEQHPDKGAKLGYLIGTRVNVFLGLIHQFIPGLLDDFLEGYK